MPSDREGIQIGAATIYRNGETPAARAIGFYSIAYKYNSETIISYRGTDDPLGLVSGGDIINGWVGGGGTRSTQAGLAFKFYNDVAQSLNGGVALDPRSASLNISLTGHSLGGGLAGLVGSVYNKSGVLFDNMPFELAAKNTQVLSDRTLAAAAGKVYDAELKELVYKSYNGGKAWAPVISSADTSKLHTYYVEGEALAALRLAQQTPKHMLSLGPGVDLPGYIPFINEAVARHSMAALTIRLYADPAMGTGVAADWNSAAKYFWPVLYDDDFAGQFIAHGQVPGTLNDDGDYASILQMALAYSAIDEGTRIFGDTGIVSLFSDANDLGKAVAGFGAGVPSTMTAYASDISKVFVEYAGELALNKVLKSSASDPVLSGVLSYSGAANNKTLTVDLSEALWKAANNGVLPEMAGPDGLADRLVNDLAVNSDPRKYPHDIRGMMGALWGDATDRAFDRAVFATAESGTTQMAAGAGTKAGILMGGAGADIMTGSAGNDLLAGGRGSDRLIGGRGNDILHGGAGEDTADYSGDPNAVSVTLAPGGHAVSDGWGGTDRLADIENLILTPKDDTLTVIGAPGMKIDAGAGTDIFVGGASVVTEREVYMPDGISVILNVETIQKTNSDYAIVLALGHVYSRENGMHLDYSQYGKALTFNLANPGTGAVDFNISDGSRTDILKAISFASIVGTNKGDIVTLQGSTVFYSGKGNDTISYSPPTGTPFAHGAIVYSGGNDVFRLTGPKDAIKIQMDHTINAADVSFQRLSSVDFKITVAGHGTILLQNIFDRVPSVYLWNNQYFDTSDPHYPLMGTPRGGSNPAPYGANGDDVVTLAPSLPYSVASTGYGNDTVYGSSGSDNIISGFGDDLMYGYAGKDYFTAGWGNDRIFGGDGDDVIFAGGGDDSIDGGAGSDTIDGGPGYDTVSYQSFSAGITIDMTAGTVMDVAGGVDRLYSIEKIIGTDFGDTSKGGAGSDQFSVSPGMDAVSDAGGNADVLLMASGVGIENLSFGTSGDDLKIIRTTGVYETIVKGQLGPDSSRIIETLQFDDGFSLNLANFKGWKFGSSVGDTMNGSSADDIILGRAGNDIVNGNNGNDTLAGDAGADTIHGNIGADTLYGGSGNDKLYGDSGNDVLFGGAGSDRLIGGAGADVLTGGAGLDRFVFDGSAGAVDTIADFNRAEDILDLSYLLPGYDPAVHAITDYVQITASGANSIIKVDLDGKGAASAWVQVATLTGVTGLTDEAALMASGHLAA